MPGGWKCKDCPARSLRLPAILPLRALSDYLSVVATTVGFVTSAAHPDLHEDDLPLVDALETRAVRVVPVVWTDPSHDPGAHRACVLRSTWDYHLDREAFLRWIDAAASRTSLWNPPAVIHANTHKFYLRELASQGIPIVPTEFVYAGARADVGVIAKRRGWESVVVKPAVSAGGWETKRWDADAFDQAQAHLARLQAMGRDVLVQRYLPTVAGSGAGERSMLWIDGAFTHSVRKNSAFEPRTAEADPADVLPGFVEAARRVLDAVRKPWLYARVDMAPGPEGLPLLMELEMTEPTLFLATSPEATERLADAILRRLRAW